MFGLELIVVAGMAGAVFIGGTVKGITGIGLPIVTMAIVVNFATPQTALALVIFNMVVTNAWQAARNGISMAPIMRFWPMIVPFVLCLFIGSRIPSRIDATTMLVLLGIAVLIFSGSELWKPRPHPLGPAAQKILAPIAGTVGGLLGGISTIWGPPMMMYLFMLHLAKDEWVRVIAILWLLGAIPLTLFYFANGILNQDTVPLATAACVPGMLGILVGERVRQYVNEARFRKILLLALFIAGLNLIRRALA